MSSLFSLPLKIGSKHKTFLKPPFQSKNPLFITLKQHSIKGLSYLLAAVALAVASTSSAIAEEKYSQVSKNGYGAVATVHPLATQAAIDALNNGGNAVDAAVAAAFTLGVVDGHNSGIGGGCFALVHWANGKVEAIDGREMAPAAATSDMYIRDGKVDSSLSKTGVLAIGIPGSVAALEYLNQQGGKLSLDKLVSPAADLAENGFPMDRVYATRLSRAAGSIGKFPSSAEILLDDSGKPWSAGHHLVQTDLSKTYRGIAKQGAKYFYQGEFAEQVGKWMPKNEGIITAKDFANYELKIRQPVKTTYRDYTIYGFPPPSSGGVHVGQILNMLEQFDVSGLSVSDRYQLLAEAMKIAFADRAHWLGDPDFVDVPRGLIDKGYAKELAKGIDLKKANKVAKHGTPPNNSTDIFGKHTTHIATADKDGNWVAITTTVNTGFGSKVIVPGTGVILNNQMDDFSAKPGTPNAYRLVGAEANKIQPGKRPLSSMSPTIVLRNGTPMLTTGAAGGPTIITQVLQTLVNHLDVGMALPDALAAPRIHHQWSPDRLFAETALDDAVKSSLTEKGHTLIDRRYMGSSQGISLSEGEFVSVSEPRLLLRNAR